MQRGESVVVDAPTSAGKTAVVERFFRTHYRDRTFRAAYTTPVKSLANDKLREFRAEFGSRYVGIATGDVKENLQAPIVVATLETYRNSLLGVDPDLERRLVVFDEYHFLQDPSRGSAWEEAVILTPPECQILMLSASVANPEQFCMWLEAAHNRRARVVTTSHRPVPLVPLVFHEQQWLLADELSSENRKNALKSKTRSQRQRGASKAPHARDIATMLLPLVSLKLVPIIVYAGRRFPCERLADTLCERIPRIHDSDRKKIEAELSAVAEEFSLTDLMPKDLRQMILQFGVAYHHSGLPPPARIGIEALLKKGLVRYCFATMGLSLGINFSVRATMVSDFDRPGEMGFVDYSASEVLQMIGRAGRRGKDHVGFNLWPSLAAFRKMGRPKREGVTSQLRHDPTTFLGLISRNHSASDIAKFYKNSFARHQNPTLDYGVHDERTILKRLGETPCLHPVAEFARYHGQEVGASGGDSLCRRCPHQKKCHADFRSRQSPLAQLHVHLHMIGALTDAGELTHFGNCARFFPQNGGLLLAFLLAEDEVSEDRLGEILELAACLALAHYKHPHFPESYRFPWDVDHVMDLMERFYPYDLFPEIYDDEVDDDIPFREFNPAAGYLVRSWLEGVEWGPLTREVCTAKFATGDVMNLLFRISTYLKSLILAAEGQAYVPAAKQMARQLLRSPLNWLNE